MAIFKKTDEEGHDMTPVATIDRPQPKQPKQPAQSNSVSVIGPTMEFNGELSADEDLIIEGKVKGTIAHHKKHLTVGRQGRVEADIHASSVIVLGELVGDIFSDGSVTLSKGAFVKGNILCGRIIMEDGARFKGTIDMGEPAKVATVPQKSKASDKAPGEQDPNASQEASEANVS
ncbi:MAG: bactofilin family protein [Gammaproteobacteria bacterium]